MPTDDFEKNNNSVKMGQLSTHKEVVVLGDVYWLEMEYPLHWL